MNYRLFSYAALCFVNVVTCSQSPEYLAFKVRVDQEKQARREHCLAEQQMKEQMRNQKSADIRAILSAEKSGASLTPAQQQAAASYEAGLEAYNHKLVVPICRRLFLLQELCGVSAVILTKEESSEFGTLKNAAMQAQSKFLPSYQNDQKKE